MTDIPKNIPTDIHNNKNLQIQQIKNFTELNNLRN